MAAERDSPWGVGIEWSAQPETNFRERRAACPRLMVLQAKLGDVLEVAPESVKAVCEWAVRSADH